jgi:phosphomevalonate kinase
LVDAANQADIPYLTPNLKRISEIAEACGGAAKPSGAGGGDCSVAFFPGLAATEQFKAACKESKLQILPIHPSQGVHLGSEH